MRQPKKLTLFIGPEGSGTTYLWRCFCFRNKELIQHELWHQKFFLKSAEMPPAEGLSHLSLPSLRPALWMDELEHKVDVATTRIVAVIRDKKFAVRSAHRRFGLGRESDHVERRQYDQAIQYIYGTVVDKFETLVVPYRELGDAAVRAKIERFVGLKAHWLPYQNKDV